MAYERQPQAIEAGPAQFLFRLVRLGSIARSLAILCASVAWAAPNPWRSGWSGLADPERQFAAAQEMGFNALIAAGMPDKVEEFARHGRQRGIDVFWWYALVPEKGQESLCQKMSPEEEEALRRIQSDKDPGKSGYQFGGEPVAFWRGSAQGPVEVLVTPILCFHRPEVTEAARLRLRKQVESCPSLAGVAFDYIGYRNYRSCWCEVSMAAFDAWRKAHPQVPPEKARDAFSLETLVEFNNALADHVRSLRPGLKVATHVYPVFLPEPLYGNRLNVDYCCQTAAWFFEPYWPDHKVRDYARAIVEGQERHFRGARGIPFLGLYVNRPSANKPVERFARELEIIFDATGDTSISIHDFAELVKREEYLRAFIRAVRARATSK